MSSAIKLGPISEEYANAQLGDRRRVERAKAIAESLHKQPADGFPRALGSSAELEGFYRFINSDDFSASDIVAPHIAATFRRAAVEGDIIAVHDTTTVEYSTERRGFGYTTHLNKTNGFIAHVTLLLSESEGTPLGVGHLETWTRAGGKNVKKRGKSHRIQSKDDPSRESLRWLRGIQSIEQCHEKGFNVVHVTDAEGDFFELFSELQKISAHFVIRAGHAERSVLHAGQERSVREVADSMIRPVTHREIELSERRHPKRSNRSARVKHPDRGARRARVAIAATQITLNTSSYFATPREPFKVNLVRVWEPQPPKGELAVEWLLLTTERISTAASLRRVVDIYRKRWVIEEYFKALKSGCAVEKRQIESYAALCKVLALFIPIAHRILLMRSLERAHPEASAAKAFSRIELEIMTRAPSNKGLAPPKTIQLAMLHLARLGGHIRNNGSPGWQTLAWGYEKLLTLRLGWEIARASKCDQS
jgi:hypothetical protein